jgi:hypothetical protein
LLQGNGHRKAADPDSEPNFYNMSFLPAAETVHFTVDDAGLPLVKQIADQYHNERVTKRTPAIFSGHSDSKYVSRQLPSLPASSSLSATSELNWLDSLPARPAAMLGHENHVGPFMSMRPPAATVRNLSADALLPLIPNVVGSIPPPLIDLLAVAGTTSPMSPVDMQLLLMDYQHQQSILSAVQRQRQQQLEQQYSNPLLSLTLAEQLVANERQLPVASAAATLGDIPTAQQSRVLFPAAAGTTVVPPSSNNPIHIHLLQNLITRNNPTTTMPTASNLGDEDLLVWEDAARSFGSSFNPPPEQKRG